VCVPSEQCAALGRWLTEHRDEIAAASGLDEGGLPEGLSLYVVLCYRECETDTVPVPSESCRSADESMAASRILESFELRLRLAPPGPAGELAGGALAEAVERLLQIAATGASEGESDGGEGSEDGEVGAAALRRELVAWATTGRPELPDQPCLGAPADDCGELTDEPSGAVLLARVDLGIEAGGEAGGVTPVDPAVDDDDRPLLLSSRSLQEWLTGLVAHPELFAPGDHSVLDNLDADDHPQYLLADGSRPLTGTLNAGHNVILNLRRSNGPTHAMRRDEIVGLDLDRTPDGLRLTGIQGEPLEASGDDAPSEGDVLRYDGTRWMPAAIPTPGPGPGPKPDPPTEPAIRSVLPLVTIERLGRGEAGATFLLWFAFEAPEATEVLAPVDDDQPLVYGTNLDILVETCEDGHPSLRRVAGNRVQVTRVACNVFRVDVMRVQAEYLRFVFHTHDLRLESGRAVEEYAQERGIAWVGQGEKATVTKFVVNPTLERPLEGFEDVEVVVAPAGGAEMLRGRR
jgi:hypothetical protein